MENNCIFLSMYHLPSVCCTLVLEIHVCSEMLHVHVLWCIDVIHVNSKDWSYFIVGHEDEKWCTPRAALALENEYHCLPPRWCMFFPSTTLKIWYCTRCRENPTCYVLQLHSQDLNFTSKQPCIRML